MMYAKLMVMSDPIRQHLKMTDEQTEEGRINILKCLDEYRSDYFNFVVSVPLIVTESHPSTTSRLYCGIFGISTG
jgi:hypothetical protein